MKIRTNFVSNSSTSSFVVRDRTIEEVRDFLEALTAFERDHVPDGVYHRFDLVEHCTEPIELTLDDIKNGKASDLSICNELHSIVDGVESIIVFEDLYDSSIPFHIHDILRNALNAEVFHT